jgi:hypothetical protein
MAGPFSTEFRRRVDVEEVLPVDHAKPVCRRQHANGMERVLCVNHSTLHTGFCAHYQPRHSVMPFQFAVSPEVPVCAFRDRMGPLWGCEKSSMRRGLLFSSLRTTSIGCVINGPRRLRISCTVQDIKPLLFLCYGFVYYIWFGQCGQ